VNTLRLRPGFGEPGADMYFDAAGAPVMIETPKGVKYWRSSTDAKTWQYWKWVWRSSLFLYVTWLDHLWCTHMAASNGLVGATREGLPPAHPLRRFLTMFTYNAIYVNSLAVYALIGLNGLLHRATPFSDWKQVSEAATALVPSLETRFGMFVDSNVMKSLPQEVQNTPFYQDGQILFDSMRKLVDGWFSAYPKWCSAGNVVDEDILFFWKRVSTWSLYYQTKFDTDSKFLGLVGQGGSITCDGFKKWLTIHIFHVTGWHRHVGTVADDAADPDWASWAWRPGERFARPRQALMAAETSAATATLWPKISEDWGFITSGMENSGQAKELLATWRVELQNLKKTVESRNAKRAIPYYQMHPDQVEMAVSV